MKSETERVNSAESDKIDLAVYLGRIKNVIASQTTHPHLRWWFRGQRDSTWHLEPGVYRKDFDIPAPLKGKSEDEEARRLRVERHLFREFNDQAVSLVSTQVSIYEMYFIQQHYRMPTRLLDWSTDPLVGLYFAVAKDPEHEKKDKNDPSLDGMVYILDAYEMVARQTGREDFGIGTLQHPEVEAALGRIAWKQKEFPDFSFPLQAAKRDVRIRNQSSCFTFHVPKMSVLVEKQLGIQSIKIPADDKKALRAELTAIQVHPFRVYGDLENLSKTVAGQLSGKGIDW